MPSPEHEKTIPEPDANVRPRSPVAPIGREHRGIQREIADADKLARTGRREEPVRNTPPSGDWNDVARSTEGEKDGNP